MPCSRSSSAAAWVIALTPNAPAAQSPRPGGGAARRAAGCLNHRCGRALLEQEGAGRREEGEGGAGGGGGPGIERLGRSACDRPAAERAAAIAAVGCRGVEDEIDRAVRCGRLLEHLAHARLVGHVAAHGERACGGDAGQRLLRPRDARHGPALGDEQLDRGATEVAGSEDDCAPAGEDGSLIHRSIPDRSALAAATCPRWTRRRAGTPRGASRIGWLRTEPLWKHRHTFGTKGVSLRETPCFEPPVRSGRAGSWQWRRVRSRDACPHARRACPEKDDPRGRGQPADATRRAAARDAPRRGPVRRGGDARRRGRRAAAAQRQRPQGQHDAARGGGQRRGRDPRRRRRLQGDPRPHRRRGTEGQRRAQADPPRAQLRRGARAREHRRARRACRRRRQLHPARHGGVDVRRPDAARVPVAPRGGPHERGHRPPVVPLPHAGRPRGAAPARAEPALRQGRLPRARGGRVSRRRATSMRPTRG